MAGVVAVVDVSAGVGAAYDVVVHWFVLLASFTLKGAEFPISVGECASAKKQNKTNKQTGQKRASPDQLAHTRTHKR